MTKARKFLRVSSGKQEEAKQVDDVLGFIAAKGFEDDGRDYLAHGKSAYRGKHLPLLLEAIQDMARGQYDVLVLWDSSRFTRMGAESIFDLMRRAREAGGSIQFAAAHAQGLNQASEWTPVMLALQATADKLESDRKKAHTDREIAKHQESGSVHGKPSWGLEVEGEKDAKRFVPTAEGRTWVPQMYAWALAGDGCLKIARRLTETGTGEGKKWSEGVVNHLIRNPVYYGHRRNGGNLETEALVPFGVWQQANAAIDGRKRQRGGASKHPPVLLKPVCLACFGAEREGCRNGISIAYLNRYPSGGAAYKCMGSGPQRKGCGAHVIPAHILDAMVIERFGLSPQAQMTRRFIPGRDIAAELKDLTRRAAEAMAKGDYRLAAKLSEEAQEVSQAEDSRGCWASEPSGLTMGQHFRQLDRDGQRAYLSDFIILAERAKDGAVRAGEYIMSDDGASGILDMWN